MYQIKIYFKLDFRYFRIRILLRVLRFVYHRPYGFRFYRPYRFSSDKRYRNKNLSFIDGDIDTQVYDKVELRLLHVRYEQH